MRYVGERRQLAAALRWAARLGMQEAADNHFSLAVSAPDHAPGEVFLINPYGALWSEVSASSLVLCRADGTVLEGDGPVEATAFHIHAPIHRRHPEHGRAVLHTHDPYTTALASTQGGRLEPCNQNALLLLDRVRYDDEYQGLALDSAEGERMAQRLGDGTILFLAGHGVLAVGPTVADAFNDLYLTERVARNQVLAESTGRPLLRITDDVVRLVSEQAKSELPLVAERYFAAITRVLAAEEPDYLN